MFIISFLSSATMTQKKWKKGQTFSEYLQKYHISKDFLQEISLKEKKYFKEIDNKQFYELKDNKGVLLQVLIPIKKGMQIHLAKEKNTKKYLFKIIPIVYERQEYYAKVSIKNSLYIDTLRTIKNKKVAYRLSKALKNVIDEKKLHKGDEINFIYTQNIRMGKVYMMPKVQVVRLQMRKNEKFIYVDEKGKGFLETEKKVPYTVYEKKKITYTKKIPISKKKSRFIMPLRRVRVTSHFSHKRYHPILRRYRPHHGTDFGAKRGTPLLAVNAGKVSFSGRNGGYGKVVKIKHASGYESLYAHQSRIRVKRGQKVKRGQIIGYVGSTGRSTGPHLHFGLKKNGRWINPMTVLGKKSIKLFKLKKSTKFKNVKITKYKTVEIKNIKKNKQKLQSFIVNNEASYIWSK